MYILEQYWISVGSLYILGTLLYWIYKIAPESEQKIWKFEIGVGMNETTKEALELDRFNKILL